MNNKVTNGNIFGRITPKGVSGWLGLIIIIILAFSFGILVSGGNESTDEVNIEQSSKTSSKPEIWTCSMHPQIKLPKPGKCPICFMDLIPLETGLGEDLGPRQLLMSESAKKLAQIQTTPVRRAFSDAEIRMPGKLSYDETKLSYITAWTGGRLEKLYADFTGITVSKGQEMVLLYSPELFAAQEELLQAIKMESSISDENSILKKTAKATIEAVEDKLRLLGLTKSQIEEIKKEKNITENITIYAPASGVVTKIHAREGNYVKTGDRIYTIADLSSLWVFLDAYESDLVWLKNGQEVIFTIPSYPGKEYKARIVFIDPVVDQKTRTVKVRAVVNNTDYSLKPDMFVSGVVKSRLDESGGIAKKNSEAPLLIPATAPLITGTRAVVYVEVPSDEGALFEGREVQLGQRSGDYYIVKSGLEENELVVTNGAFKLDSELQIQAKPSMMSPKGGGGPVGHQHGGEMTTAPKNSGIKESDSDQLDFKALEALTPIYNAYFEIQMSLAGDDMNSAKAGFMAVSSKVKEVDMSLFEGDTHMTWMKMADAIVKASEKGADAVSIEEARSSFLSLSKPIVELEKSFGHGEDKDYYLTFCPMANDNKGAHWLQTVDTVYNSFYGAKMLRCGSIKDTLPAKQNTNSLEH